MGTTRGEKGARHLVRARNYGGRKTKKKKKTPKNKVCVDGLTGQQTTTTTTKTKIRQDAAFRQKPKRDCHKIKRQAFVIIFLFSNSKRTYNPSIPRPVASRFLSKTTENPGRGFRGIASREGARTSFATSAPSLEPL